MEEKSTFKSWLFLFLKSYWPMLVCFAFVFAISFFFRTDYLDDAYFIDIFERDFDFNIFSFIEDHYNSWSSRLIIEPITILMLEVPFLWRVCQALMMSLLAYSLYRIINKRNSFIALICVLAALVYPLIYNYEMGFVTTSLNYLWTMTFCIYIISVLIRIYRHEKVYAFSYVLTILAAFYCANEEIMSVALVLLATIFAILFYKQGEKKHWLCYVLALIAFSELIFAITCPGNRVRYDASVASFFPSFNQTNFFTKILIGYSRIGVCFTFSDNAAMLLVAMVLALANLTSKKSPIFMKIISFVPLLIVLIFGVLLKLDTSEYSFYHEIWNFAIDNSKIVPDMSNIYFLFPVLTLSVAIICLVASILAIYPFKWKGAILLGILLLGFGTQIGLSLTPTSTLSKYFEDANSYLVAIRSQSFFAMSLIVISVIILKDILDNDNQLVKYGTISGLFIFASVCLSYYLVNCPALIS